MIRTEKNKLLKDSKFYFIVGLISTGLFFANLILTLIYPLAILIILTVLNCIFCFYILFKSINAGYNLQKYKSQLSNKRDTSLLKIAIQETDKANYNKANDIQKIIKGYSEKSFLNGYITAHVLLNSNDKIKIYDESKWVSIIKFKEIVKKRLNKNLE